MMETNDTKADAKLSPREAFETWLCFCSMPAVYESKPKHCHLDNIRCGLYIVIPVRP